METLRSRRGVGPVRAECRDVRFNLGRTGARSFGFGTMRICYIMHPPPPGQKKTQLALGRVRCGVALALVVACLIYRLQRFHRRAQRVKPCFKIGGMFVGP